MTTIKAAAATIEAAALAVVLFSKIEGAAMTRESRASGNAREKATKRS